MPDSRVRLPVEPILQLLGHFQPSTIRYNRRVFVNRNLRMKNIQAIGFDMDYTLAIYKPEFDRLVWDLTLTRLVSDGGFPTEVKTFKYDPEFAVRGLVIDMVRGNIVKMDRHRHVSRVYHGTRAVDDDTRRTLYRRGRIHLSRPTLALIDTLFHVPETHVFAQMVDLLDSRGEGDAGTYRHAYQVIRETVDDLHRDGSLKREVMMDLGRYIVDDPEIAYTLERLVYSGKRLFLATNSGWLYSDAVMSYLLNGRLASFPRWTDYFQHIIVEATKPDFFSQRSPLKPEENAQADIAHKVFRNGNLRGLEGLLNTSGEAILYIGDHIYGDILRSKKSSAWRTAMIIPEMENELAAVEMAREDQLTLERLFTKRRNLEIETNYLQRLLASLLGVDELVPAECNSSANPVLAVADASEKNIAATRQALDTLEIRERAVLERLAGQFNQRWGPLFKEGNGHSIFGEQVEAWACIYTSRVTNFLSYSPIQYFRAPPDLLPHER